MSHFSWKMAHMLTDVLADVIISLLANAFMARPSLHSCKIKKCDNEQGHKRLKCFAVAFITFFTIITYYHIIITHYHNSGSRMVIFLTAEDAELAGEGAENCDPVTNEQTLFCF